TIITRADLPGAPGRVWASASARSRARCRATCRTHSPIGTAAAETGAITAAPVRPSAADPGAVRARLTAVAPDAAKLRHPENAPHVASHIHACAYGGTSPGSDVFL